MSKKIKQEVIETLDMDKNMTENEFARIETTNIRDLNDSSMPMIPAHQSSTPTATQDISSTDITFDDIQSYLQEDDKTHEADLDNEPPVRFDDDLKGSGGYHPYPRAALKSTLSSIIDTMSVTRAALSSMKATKKIMSEPMKPMGAMITSMKGAMATMKAAITAMNETINVMGTTMETITQSKRTKPTR